MSQMLMPSDSVSVCKTRIRIDYEFVGVQPVGSPDVILVGFEPESVRFPICVLMNLFEVTPVT